MRRRVESLLRVLTLSLVVFLYPSPDACAAQAQLAWDQSSDPSVTGYKVYYGTQSGNYPSVVDVGASLGYTVTGLSAQTWYFAVTAYSATAESGFSPELVCYFITPATPSNGQITPGGATIVAGGSSQTFQVSPNTGYGISNVYVDDTSVGAVSTYTFDNVTANHTISADFIPLAANYTISAGTQGSGSISPSGTVSVPSGASQAFTITPAANYFISNVSVDGSPVGAVSSYTFNNVTANHTIVAAFSPITAFTISASTHGSGSISPSGTVSVPSGGDQTFTIAPAAGYRISKITVDGRSVGAALSYTFSNVAANHTISACFTAIKYKIWARGRSGGWISPSGTITVLAGTNTAYTITPARGHKLADLLIDGTSYRKASGQASNGVLQGGPSNGSFVYTFTDVSSNHTIQPIFFRVPPPVADAGPDQDVINGSTVTLNGSNSTDSLSGIASYQWVQTSGPRVNLSTPTSPVCIFTAPDISSGEALMFKLAVTNNAGLVSRATCIVNICGTDTAPLANAGADQTVHHFAIVTLDGSGSYDPGGRIVSYRWVQIGGPQVQIWNANAAQASFVAPVSDPAGASLVFSLQVMDGLGLATRDQCIVNVVEANHPPVANAGPDQTAAATASVTLDGSGSYDPAANSADSYRWKQVRGAPVTLSDPTAINPYFTLPAYAGVQNADLLFVLTVTDAQNGLSDTAKCTVRVTSQ